ncbi:hypothetical protein [Rhizobium sp. NXC24]|uniref:hypothetical protein n=1 Tax=Rhizobium sp. NXC24 TaxID=2048897 RepID=UPI000CDF4412|nr:hypothetical protein [Rhizobium sp. NXC24]AVA23856.1 hypothetical protein NXC24_PA00211 [Rhizobium sp. NXC24]
MSSSVLGIGVTRKTSVVAAAMSVAIAAPSILMQCVTMAAASESKVTLVGDQLKSATLEGFANSLEIGPDLHSKALDRILPGDWATFAPEAPLSLKEGSELKLCSFLKMHIEHPDPLYPIFNVATGLHGSQRSELRIIAGTKFYLIANVFDQMRALGLEEAADPKANDAMNLQRGLALAQSISQGTLVPVSDDVLAMINVQNPYRPAFMVRCPSASDNAANVSERVSSANAVKKKMEESAAFLSYGADGTVPFVSKMQGLWTLVDDANALQVSKMRLEELCRVRRIEVRAEHAPLPILTSHAVDGLSAEQRPVPASQDEFELRLAGNNELMRVPTQDPMKDVLENPTRLEVPSALPGDIVANRRQQEAVRWYRHAVLSSALPVTLSPIDENTFVEKPIQAWKLNGELPDLGLFGFERFWLRCPA